MTRMLEWVPLYQTIEREFECSRKTAQRIATRHHSLLRPVRVSKALKIRPGVIDYLRKALEDEQQAQK